MGARNRLSAGFMKKPEPGKHLDGAGLWLVVREDGNLPGEVDADHFKRAAELVGNYVLPMARRAYADAAVPQAERSARRMVATIREKQWKSFTARQVTKLERAGLATAELTPALALLEDADCIREVLQPAQPQGGRPSRLFIVNPALLA
jgi:hypothetical protein